MQLLIDILQGAGLAGAAGIRPILPTLVAGALATADVGIDYEGTPFAFMESSAWLLAVAVALLIAVAVARRRDVSEGPIDAALQGICDRPRGAAVRGDARRQHRHLVAGPARGWSLRGARRLRRRGRSTTRVRARLDAEARGALPVYLEGTAVVLAGLSVVVAPISVLALGFFAFLLRGGRRREGEKYAGLRILR